MSKLEKLILEELNNVIDESNYYQRYIGRPLRKFSRQIYDTERVGAMSAVDPETGEEDEKHGYTPETEFGGADHLVPADRAKDMQFKHNYDQKTKSYKDVSDAAGWAGALISTPLGLPAALAVGGVEMYALDQSHYDKSYGRTYETDAVAKQVKQQKAQQQDLEQRQQKLVQAEKKARAELDAARKAAQQAREAQDEEAYKEAEADYKKAKKQEEDLAKAKEYVEEKIYQGIQFITNLTKKQKAVKKKAAATKRTKQRSKRKYSSRPIFLRTAVRSGYKNAFVQKYGNTSGNSFKKFYRDAKVPAGRQDFQFGKTHMRYWNKTFGSPKLNEIKELQQLNEIDALEGIEYGLYALGTIGAILFLKRPLVGGYRALFKNTARNARNVSKINKNVVGNLTTNQALNQTTRAALKNQTKTMNNNITKMFDDIDDFIRANKRGGLDEKGLSAIRLRIQNSAMAGQKSTKELIEKTKQLLKDPNLSNAERGLLDDSLKQLNEQSKSLYVLADNARKADKLEDIVALTLGASQKYGNNFISRLKLTKQYGKGYIRQLGGPALKVSAVPTIWLGKTIFVAYMITNWFGPWISRALVENFDTEEVIEMLRDMFNNQEIMGKILHYASVFFDIETFEELPGAAKGIIQAENFISKMTDEKRKEERVDFMKNTLASLAMIKMSDFKKPSYEKAIMDFNEFMKSIDASYSSIESATKKALVKQNALEALDEAANDILSTKFPMAKLMTFIAANQSDVVPSGAKATEFLYEKYFFDAVKQIYPGLEVNEKALFDSPKTRKAALQEMLSYLKSNNAKPGILKVFELKAEKPTRNVVSRSRSLKNFIERKYFDGQMSDYITGVKNSAVRLAHKDMEKILQNH